jgi:two-component system, chemotaxis family, protein-glutamate methylesterase/glutaminase
VTFTSAPAPPPSPDPLTVLVIDDSAVIRQFMSQLGERRADVNVVTAADPVIAESKLLQIRPDVILLDLEMPRMSGLEFLRRQMRRDPLPIVVCSSFATAGSERAIAALAEGAIEVLPKPTLGMRQFLDESVDEILATLRAAAAARIEWRAPGRGPDPRPLSIAPTASRDCGDAIVGCGASTGGPQALDLLFTALRPPFPPVVVVQHMPRSFTAAFARRLDSRSEFDVREASDGEILAPGMVRIAPGDEHVVVERRRARYRTRLESGPRISLHRPSVDVLFHSLAKAAPSQAAGILLTGMGRDGAEGLLAMRRAGAFTIAEDESSAVVFGMPREAIGLGASQETLHLAAIPERLCRWASSATASTVSERSRQ